MKRKNWLMASAGLLVSLAAAPAMAQTWTETGDAGDLPATAQNCFGDGSPITQINGNLAASDVDMYRVKICDIATFVADVQGTWDSQLSLWRLDGTGIMFDDDRNGSLAAYLDNTLGLITSTGEYYLAIHRFNRKPRDASAQAIFHDGVPYWPAYAPDGPGAANPVASWLGTTTATAYSVNLTGVCSIVPVTPTNPSVSAAFNPAAVEIDRTVTLQATVTPGLNPPSAGITVTADLSAVFGLSPTQAMLDNGNPANGDAFAGDGIYSCRFTVPNSTPLGPNSLTVTVNDNYPRSGNTTVNFDVKVKSWNEQADGGGDSGDLPVTAQVCSGSGSLKAITGDHEVDGVDMYRITICDPTLFDATLVGQVTWDSQIWLFDSTGKGVLHNDDDTGVGASHIHNLGGQITAPGTYYIAVSAYNRDPVDSGAAFLWNNTPFTGVRAPDGPGQANAVASWTGTTAAQGAYRIEMQGVCYYDPTTPTPPTATLALSPNLTEVGRTILLTANVIPATNPTSASHSVQADLTALGGTASETLYDDGPAGGHGDAVLGDGIFSLSFAITNSAILGPGSLPFTVTELTPPNRSSIKILPVNVGIRSWNEQADGGGDSGDLTTTGQVCAGSGDLKAITGDLGANEADLFIINICDPLNFSASTVGTTTADTMLWLFKLDGTGIIAEDDSVGLQSEFPVGNFITSSLTPGNYAIALTEFLFEPVSTLGPTDYLWDTYDLNGPDGIGAANPLGGWAGAGAAIPGYRINLTGTCLVEPSGPVACSIADIATEGNPDIQAGPDGFITGVDADAFIECFNNLTRKALPTDPPGGPYTGPYIADVIGDLGVGPPNGFVEGVDADAFFEAYFIGC